MKTTIKNFKGIKNLEVNISSKTYIVGGNGVGKTSILDAFFFIVDGKDYSDKKVDYSYINKSEIASEVVLEYNNSIYKKILKNDDGKSVIEYYINDIPVKKGEFEGNLGIKREWVNPLYWSDLTNKEFISRLTGVDFGEFDNNTKLINILKKDIEFINNIPEFANKYNVRFILKEGEIETVRDIIADKINKLELANKDIFATIKEELKIGEYKFDINGNKYEYILNDIEGKLINNAADILKGVELCLFLQKKHNIRLPIFIDNAEAIDDGNLERITSKCGLVATFVAEGELKVINK